MAEPEVSWDGTAGASSPTAARTIPGGTSTAINVDGTGLQQLTDGPYHNVGPAWLPDGRIVFASSRSGIRDEYHGYPCTALCVMNADGSDLHPIATNIGRDNEPAVLPDGRIVFSRLEVFYSRNKTELTLHAVHPDGTQDVVLYGPERRAFWRNLNHGAPDPADGQEAPLTHRVLRMTQPQPMPDGRQIIVSTQGGLTLIGPRRDTEDAALPRTTRTAPTPRRFRCPTARCSAPSTLQDAGPREGRPGPLPVRSGHGPAGADLQRSGHGRLRGRGRSWPAGGRRRAGRWTDRRPTAAGSSAPSVFATQEPEVRARGRLVRLIEGVPVVGRHSTQTSPRPGLEEPRRHAGPRAGHGAAGRRRLVLRRSAGRSAAALPGARQRPPRGRQPADLDLRRGPARPSRASAATSTRTAARRADPLAAHYPPLSFLPTGREFTYRAKAWFKGSLPPEIEERTRTVHAVNLLAR